MLITHKPIPQLVDIDMTFIYDDSATILSDVFIATSVPTVQSLKSLRTTKNLF